MLQDLEITASCSSLESLLYDSIMTNTEEDVKSILRQGVDVQTKLKGPLTGIHIAVVKGHLNIIEHLLRMGVDVNSRYPVANNRYTGSTLLYRAAAKGDEAVVSLLLQYNADCRAENVDRSTALHIATERGYLQIIKLLLSKGAKVNFENYEDPNEDLYTDQFLESKILRDELKLETIDVSNISIHEGAYSPLHLAVKARRVDIIDLLIESGADVNAEDGDGETALSLAVLRGCLATFKCVLNHSPSVKKTGYKRALSHAVKCKGEKHRLMIEDILQYGFSYDSDIEEYDELLPYNAIDNGYSNVIRNIFSDDEVFGVHAEANRKEYASILLSEAIKEGNEEICTFLLAQGASVEKSFRLSEVYMKEMLNLDLLKVLFENGLDVRKDPKFFVSAVKKEMHSLIEILLKHEADVNSCIEDEWFLRNYSCYLPYYEEKIPVKEVKISPILVAAALGDEISAKLLLEYGANLNFETDKGLTPLHLSICGGHLGTVEILLKSGASVHAPDFNKRTPLYLAAEFGHVGVVKLLLRYGAKMDAGSDNDHFRSTPVHIAAEKGHLNVIKAFLEFDAHKNSIHTVLPFQRNTLHCAVGNRHNSTIKFLIEQGVKINTFIDTSSSILSMAAWKGYTEIIELLLESGANVRNFRNSDENDPLISAVDSGDEKLVSLVLKYGADPNVFSNSVYNYPSPLTSSADKGNLKIVRLLLDYGADVDYCTSFGETALLLALQKGHGEVAKLLLENDAKFTSPEQRNECFLRCSEKGHMESVELLLRDHVDINFTDRDGRTALHLAAKGNHNNIVERLLKSGANVNLPDVKMMTPLMLSVASGHLEVIKTLLKSGADAEKADSSGRTALYVAAKNGSEEVLNILIAHGVNADDAAGHFKTPLCIAAEKGYAEVISTLIKKGANPNSLDEKGQSALYLAAKHGCADVVNLLLECGAEIDAVEENGKTPLLIAVERGHFEIVKTLVKTGANVNSSDSDGRTAMYFAAEFGHTDTVNLLLEYKATVNTCVEKGKFPLSICSKRGHSNCVRTLLKFGADIHATDGDGLTAVHHAAGVGHYGVLEQLLKHCANINCKSTNDVPLMILCAEKGLNKTVDVLMKFGASFDVADKRDAIDHLASSLHKWDLKIFTRALEYCSADRKFISEADLRALFEAVNELLIKQAMTADELSNYNSLAKCLVQFWIKLKAANVYSSGTNLVATAYCDEEEISSFEEECAAEVIRMKGETIGDTDISVYDIIMEGPNRLASFVRNVGFRKALNSPDFDAKYPLYCNIIRNQFDKGRLRRQLIDECVKVCQSPFSPFVPVPSNIVETMLLYLNNKDLRNLLVSKHHSCVSIQ